METPTDHRRSLAAAPPARNSPPKLLNCPQLPSRHLALDRQAVLVEVKLRGLHLQTKVFLGGDLKGGRA